MKSYNNPKLIKRSQLEILLKGIIKEVVQGMRSMDDPNYGDELYSDPDWVSRCCQFPSIGELDKTDPKNPVGICLKCHDHATFDPAGVDEESGAGAAGGGTGASVTANVSPVTTPMAFGKKKIKEAGKDWGVVGPPKRLYNPKAGVYPADFKSVPNYVRIKKSQSPGEFIVAWFTNGKFNDDKSYYTTDLGDAYDTLVAMKPQVDAANSISKETIEPLGGMEEEGIVDKLKGVGQKLGIVDTPEVKAEKEKIYKEVHEFFRQARRTGDFGKGSVDRLRRLLANIFEKYNVPPDRQQHYVNAVFALRASHVIDLSGGHRPYLREMTTTMSGTPGYNIPGCFAKKGGSKKGIEGSESIGYTLTPIGQDDMERRADKLLEGKDQPLIYGKPICRFCKTPLRSVGQIECHRCGKVQPEIRSGEASHAKRFATKPAPMQQEASGLGADFDRAQRAHDRQLPPEEPGQPECDECGGTGTSDFSECCEMPLVAGMCTGCDEPADQAKCQKCKGRGYIEPEPNMVNVPDTTDYYDR